MLIGETAKPLFCIVLGDGDKWLVEAEWPDGTIEQVDTFRGHTEASTWISTRSEAWLQERSSGRIRIYSPASL